jgi:hypothetical protein
MSGCVQTRGDPSGVQVGAPPGAAGIAGAWRYNLPTIESDGCSKHSAPLEREDARPTGGG